MANTIYTNELRISLKELGNLDLFQCTSLILSSRHKRHIESFLKHNGWVALFEGAVLFAIVKSPSHVMEERAEFLQALEGKLRNFNQANLKTTKLAQVPQRVVERISFAIVSFQAARQGIFQIYDRVLFRPRPQPEKFSHSALETTISIEDGFIKIYITPTWIALLNINETYREQLSNVQLVHMCKFRTKELCNLANENGTCSCVYPKGLGYYDNEVSFDLLDESENLIFRNHYKDCPQLKTITKVILTKATKKDKKFSIHPSFTVFAGISKSDLQAHPTWLKQYRNITLMPSKKRWQETMRWLSEIFPQADLASKNCKTHISIGDVQIPIDILITTPIEYSPNINNYRSIQIPSLPIVNDQQDPKGKNVSGGYLFNLEGSYDRDDVNRQFDTITPYLIVPTDIEIQKLTQSLFEIFSDGEYQPRTIGDKQFLGINRPENKAKYNTKFINPWRSEEGIFTVENYADPEAYWRATQDIKREWNSNSQKDLNRIAIVITPSSKENEDDLYFRLKKVFIEEGIPSQFISFETLQKLKNNSIAFGPVLQSLWLNIYAKLGGKPWRLAGQLENVHCFIGIGFGLNTEQENKGKHIYAGVAHVFDRFGSWIDIASGSQTLSGSEYESFDGPQKYLHGTDSFKISETLTQEIVYNALRLYQQNQTQTHEPPQNIVLHKLGPIYESEVLGVLEGVRQLLGTLEKCKLGIVQIEQDHQVRLYGPLNPTDGKLDRTVLRGTGLIINKQKIALASTGSTQRKSGTFYSGIGTPQPLLITSVLPSPSILNKYTIRSNQFYETLSLARHVMALTQLHWGSTKDNIRLPITAMYAQKVADLISKTKANVDTWASYHRPWFL